MGNSESTPSTLEHLSKRFIRSPHPMDPEQNSLFLLHERLSENKFILRIVTTNDEEERAHMQELICKKLATNKIVQQTHSLTCIDHYLFEQDKGYCNLLNKVFILFDITQAESLTHHLTRGYYNNSNTSMQKVLSEEIIHKGLLNLVQGLSLLQHYKHPHLNICCSTVYFKNNTFMLSDPWIAVNPEENFYSPEKLQEMRNEVGRQDPYISDLFSIGMVGLKTAGFSDLSRFYHMTTKKIDLNGIHELIGKIQNENLRVLLRRLLGNTGEREELLKEIRNKNLTQISPFSQNGNEVKTRHLSGKVSSVRKSFNHNQRPIATIGQPPSYAPYHPSPSMHNINHQPNQTHLSSNRAPYQSRPINHNVYMMNAGNQGVSTVNFSANGMFMKDKIQASTTRATLVPNSPPIPMGITNIGMIEEQSSHNNSEPEIMAEQVKKNQLNLLPFSPSPSFNKNTLPTYNTKSNDRLKTTSSEIQPFRISPGYQRDSQSFEADILYQRRIMENLKELENKVSHAIEKSRSNSNLEIKIDKNPNVSPINLSPRSNGFSHDEDVNKIVESMIIRKDSSPSAKQTLALQEEKDEVNSSLAIRTDEENYDYININESKSNSQHNSPKEENKALEEQAVVERSQQMIRVQTPERSNSNERFHELNNQTIPEESDEESMADEEQQKKGEYVEEIYENGGKYVGYLIDGQRNGEGIFYYRDGGYYDGKWKKNMMNGYGKLYYENGSLAYEGQWYKDEFHGRGKVYNDSPEPIEGMYDYKNMNNTEFCWQFYEGELSHDTKEGLGKLMLSNAQFFQGEFRKDSVHGWGTFSRKSGETVKGYWEEGIFKKQD